MGIAQGEAGGAVAKLVEAGTDDAATDLGRLAVGEHMLIGHLGAACDPGEEGDLHGLLVVVAGHAGKGEEQAQEIEDDSFHVCEVLLMGTKKVHCNQ